MSGGCLMAAGAIAVLAGVGVLGFGLWRASHGTSLVGLALLLSGFLNIEIGRRIPY